MEIEAKIKKTFDEFIELVKIMSKENVERIRRRLFLAKPTISDKQVREAFIVGRVEPKARTLSLLITFYSGRQC